MMEGIEDFVPKANTADIRRYSASEVAALVEEIKATVWDQTRARVGTILEQIEGKIHTEPRLAPSGRLLKYALDDVQRLIAEIAHQRVPDITSELLKEQRAARLRSEKESQEKERSDKEPPHEVASRGPDGERFKVVCSCGWSSRAISEGLAQSNWFQHAKSVSK